MEPLNIVGQRNADFEERAPTPIWLWASLPISSLAIVGSVLAIIFDETIYRSETANWAAQAIGQDAANIVAYSSLLVFAFLAARRSLRALLCWIGVLVYSVYTYAIYVFDIHFGPLFLLWVAVFGLSVYALIGGLSSIDAARIKARFGNGAPVRFTGYLLLAIASIFSLLWLSEVVPSSMDGTIPEALVQAGTPTNPIHVLDLSLFLPAGIMAGTLLVRRRPWGYVLAPVILTAMVFISIGIVSLTVVLSARGLEGTPAIGVGIAVLALIELGVLSRFLATLGGDVIALGTRHRHNSTAWGAEVRAESGSGSKR